MGAAVDVSTAVSGLFFGLKSEFKQSNGSRDESGDRRAARVAIKTSRSVAEIGGVAVKASLVDYPMALVDGLDGIPALLGGKTRRFEPVTDWRSGGRVACKVRIDQKMLDRQEILISGTEIWHGLCGRFRKPRHAPNTRRQKRRLCWIHKGHTCRRIRLRNHPSSWYVFFRTRCHQEGY